MRILSAESGQRSRSTEPRSQGKGAWDSNPTALSMGRVSTGLEAHYRSLDRVQSVGPELLGGATHSLCRGNLSIRFELPTASEALRPYVDSRWDSDRIRLVRFTLAIASF